MKSSISTFERDISVLKHLTLDARDVADLDDDFSEMLESARAELARPAMIETSARHFSVLIPESLHHCPLWVMWLGEEYAHELSTISQFEPRVWEQDTVDLQCRRATLEWYGRDHTFCARTVHLANSVNYVYPDGYVLIAFLTPEKLAFQTLLVDDDLIVDLSNRGMRCDYNYRAVREFSSEELEEARKKSVLLGNVPEFDTYGRRLVMLDSKRYRFTLAAL